MSGRVFRCFYDFLSSTSCQQAALTVAVSRRNVRRRPNVWKDKVLARVRSRRSFNLASFQASKLSFVRRKTLFRVLDDVRQVEECIIVGKRNDIVFLAAVVFEKLVAGKSLDRQVVVCVCEVGQDNVSVFFCLVLNLRCSLVIENLRLTSIWDDIFGASSLTTQKGFPPSKTSTSSISYPIKK